MVNSGYRKLEVGWMEKTFLKIQDYINGMKTFSRVVYTERLNEMKRPYYSLNLFIDKDIEGELDTEYIEFMQTNESLSLTWNISNLRNYILHNHPDDYAVVSLSQIREDLGETAYKRQIEAMEEEKVKLNTFPIIKQEPIYVMVLMPTRQYYILDGKHRLYEAHLKRRDIKCYYLNSDMLVPFLINEDQRRLYRFIKDFFAFCEEIGLFITNI